MFFSPEIYTKNKSFPNSTLLDYFSYFEIICHFTMFSRVLKLLLALEIIIFIWLQEITLKL